MSETNRIVYAHRDELVGRLMMDAVRIGDAWDLVEGHIEDVADELADRLDKEREADLKNLLTDIRKAVELLRFGDHPGDVERAEEILSDRLAAEEEERP